MKYYYIHHLSIHFKTQAMKLIILSSTIIGILLSSCSDNKEKTAEGVTKETTEVTNTTEHQAYFIDVHDLEPGKVTFEDVDDAHKKDLATQDKYGVKFHKFWVDEQKGKVYCLSQAKDAEAVKATHSEAHGLIPATVYQVSGGDEAIATGNKQLFIDVHEMGAGKAAVKDVADAHEKDLGAQSKHGVNFINYWVDEKKGVIMCLSETSDSNAVKQTHKEAHGLMPAYVMKVKQGQ